jgi:autotransporter translocation and assembly factor TamB
LKLIIRPKLNIFIVAIFCLMAFSFTLPFLILNDRFLTVNLQTILQKALKDSGLKLEIKNVHWETLNGLVGTGVALRDKNTGQVVITAKQVRLRLNPLILPLNIKTPEAAFTEVVLIQPRVEIRRLPDDTFNIQHYFKGNGRRLKLSGMITIRDGEAFYQDYQFGNYRLQKFSGTVNLRQFPLIRWRLHGWADVGTESNWQSQGRIRTDQQVGYISLSVKKALITKIDKFIPRPFPYRIRSGWADIQLNMALAKGYFGIESIKTTIRQAKIHLPPLPKEIYIRYLKGTFTPDLLKIYQSDISYDKTAVHCSGTLVPSSSKINASIEAERISLEDWIPLWTSTKDFQILGQAAFKLKIQGSIKMPDLNGVVTFNDARIQLQEEEPLERISGRLSIHHNDVTVNRLQGIWREARLEMSGKIINLFAPRFDIKVAGYGFQLQDLKVLQNAQLDLKTSGDSVFEAVLTGSLQKPRLQCQIGFQQVNFTQNREQEILLNEVNLQFAWVPGNIQILNASGNLWEGRICAQGTIRFEPEGIQWLISGKVSSLDLEKISLIKPFPVKGKVSTDMVLKGNWPNGGKFSLSSVFGIFTGNKLNYSNALIEEADGVFSWNDGVLTVDSIQVKINQGRVFGYLQLNRQSEISITASAENIKIRDLFPNDPRFPLNGLFNGNFDFKGPLNRFFGRIHGAFTDLTWDSKPIGDITGNIDYRDREFSVADLQIVTELGAFSVQGKLNIADEPQVDIHVTGTDTNLKGLAKWLPIDPSITIEGLGQLNLAIKGNINNPNFQGRIQLTNPGIGMIKMQDGEIELQGNLNEVVLTQCRLRNDNFKLKLSGTVNRDRIDLTIAAKSFDLSSLHFEAGGNSLQGLVDFNGQFSGPTSHPVLTADISGGHFSLGNLSYQTLNAKLKWDSEGFNISQAEFSQGTGQILLGKPLTCDLNIAVVGCKLSTLKQFVKIPPAFPVEGTLSGIIAIHGPIDNPEIQVDGSLQGTIKELAFDSSFTLFYSQQKIIIEKFELRQGNGILSANGNWESQRNLFLRIKLANFPLGIVNRLVESPLAFSGTANAEILLQWFPGRVTGEWNFEVANLDLSGNSFGNVQISGNFSEEGLFIKNGTINGKNGNIRGRGFIPWPEEWLGQSTLPVTVNPVAKPLEGDISVRNVPIALINNYFKEFTIMDGSLNGDLKIEGELTRPEVSGRLDCANLKAGISGLPLPVENVQATFEISNNYILIKRARGIYGTGRFNISGVIENDGFKQFRFNLGANGNRLYFKNQFFDGFGDVNLKLTGPFQNLLISGDISIYDSRVGIVGMGGSTSSPTTWDPQFNLQIKVGANTRCRVIGLADLSINGAIQLKGTLSEPALEGEVNSKNGVLTFYSNAFRIKNAKAVFKLSQGYYPYLDLESSLRRAQAEIFLTVKGVAPDNMIISLSSQPYMPQANILGLLNWMQLGNNQTLTPEEVISGNLSIVTDTIFEELLYKLRQTLNVNYLYLEPDRKNNDFRINMGSYLTQQLSYSFSSSIFPENRQNWNLSLSYYFSPYLSLEYNYSMLDGTTWRLIYQIKL